MKQMKGTESTLFWMSRVIQRITDSCYCTPETHIALYVNSIGIKINNKKIFLLGCPSGSVHWASAFGSGHDLRVLGSSPTHIRLSARQAAYFPSSLSASLSAYL